MTDEEKMELETLRTEKHRREQTECAKTALDAAGVSADFAALLVSVDDADTDKRVQDFCAAYQASLSEDIKKRLPEQAPTLTAGTAAVSGQTVSLPVTLAEGNASQSYTLTELGVFARDPDAGEILYQVFRLSEARPIAAGGACFASTCGRPWGTGALPSPAPLPRCLSTRILRRHGRRSWRSPYPKRPSPSPLPSCRTISPRCRSC